MVGDKEIHRDGLKDQSGVLEVVRVLTLRGASRVRGDNSGFQQGQVIKVWL